MQGVPSPAGDRVPTQLRRGLDAGQRSAPSDPCSWKGTLSNTVPPMAR